jgi:hypothetical protein
MKIHVTSPPSVALVVAVAALASLGDGYGQDAE